MFVYIYDVSTLYTALRKEKLTDLIEQSFIREGSLCWLVMWNTLFILLLNGLKDISCTHVMKLCDVINYLLATIFIRFNDHALARLNIFES